MEPAAFAARVNFWVCWGGGVPVFIGLPHYGFTLFLLILHMPIDYTVIPGLSHLPPKNVQTALYSQSQRHAQTAPDSDSKILRFSRFSDRLIVQDSLVQKIGAAVLDSSKLRFDVFCLLTAHTCTHMGLCLSNHTIHEYIQIHLISHKYD